MAGTGVAPCQGTRSRVAARRSTLRTRAKTTACAVLLDARPLLPDSSGGCYDGALHVRVPVLSDDGSAAGCIASVPAIRRCATAVSVAPSELR